MSLKDLKKRIAKLQQVTRATESCQVIIYDRERPGDLEQKRAAATAPVLLFMPDNHRQ